MNAKRNETKEKIVQFYIPYYRARWFKSASIFRRCLQSVIHTGGKSKFWSFVSSTSVSCSNHQVCNRKCRSLTQKIQLFNIFRSNSDYCTCCRRFKILFKKTKSKTCERKKIRNSCNFKSIEPIGFKAPSLANNAQSITFKHAVSTTFVLLCQAQAFPVPVFRYLHIDYQ